MEENNSKSRINVCVAMVACLHRFQDIVGSSPGVDFYFRNISSGTCLDIVFSNTSLLYSVIAINC